MKPVNRILIAAGTVVALLSAGCASQDKTAQANQGARGEKGEQGAAWIEPSATDHMAGGVTNNPPSEILPAE